MRIFRIFPLGLVGLLAIAPLRAEEPLTEVDRLLAKENAGSQLQVAPELEGLAFLRRVTVDLVGRIPTQQEIEQFEAWPKDQRRQKAVERLLAHDRFADRWTVFFADMLRIRTNAEGGGPLLAFVHQAIDKDLSYDKMCRQLISATGKVGVTPEVGFILGDGADPYALAGSTAQVFMGVRISCAQCHNHPFDVWKRKQFYDLAAYFGKTRRTESRLVRTVYITETNQSSIMWPPDEAEGVTRKPVDPSFPFEMDEGDGPRKHIARLLKLRAEQEALAKNKNRKDEPSLDDLLNESDKKVQEVTGNKKPDVLNVGEEARQAAKNLNVKNSLYQLSEYRTELANKITDPHNRFFSRNLVNRVWAELLGSGFVNPVDDFRADNEPMHPQTLDYLADEFVASGYDFRSLVRNIVLTQAYRRAHLPPSVDPALREESERAFVAAPVRRMVSEVLYDSIVQAGHLFSVKHEKGDNPVTITQTVRVPVETKETKPNQVANLPKLGEQPAEKPKPKRVVSTGYDLERAIEVDFDSLLTQGGESPMIEAMAMKSAEELEAERMMMESKKPTTSMKYVTKTVTTVIDDNPVFTSSMRMATPAPTGHFLRVFGQPGRTALDDIRTDNPSMRQALMMLNGSLTNQAARVGKLEPMYQLLASDKPDLDRAVRTAYREILTRDPSAEELDEAKAIIAESTSPLEGMADLRWVLFNCHEFRFLP